MAVSEKTELGEIRISDQIIEDMISEIISGPEMRNKIWPASIYTHRINKFPGMSDPGPGFDLDASNDENGNVMIEFSVVVRFGISIKNATKDLSDRLYDEMKYELGIKPKTIIINIAGVKSKQIARRKTRTIYRYDSEE